MDILEGCGTTNPYTGRTQHISMSEAEEIELGEKLFRDFSAQPNIAFSQDVTKLNRIKHVFSRIVSAAKSEYSGTAIMWSWEFKTINHNENIIAFSFPGGKFVISSGVLDVVGNDDELAMILGGLAGSSLARHATEKYSMAIVETIGRMGSIHAFTNSTTIDYLSESYLWDIQKEEADSIGLQLAARAGFDPKKAIKVIKAVSSGYSANRYQALEKYLDKALIIYEKTLNVVDE